MRLDTKYRKGNGRSSPNNDREISPLGAVFERGAGCSLVCWLCSASFYEVVHMALNLHHIVRGAINAVHPDELLELVRSVGQDVSDDGFVVPCYAALKEIHGQVQTESEATLHFADMVGQNEHTRKIYLYAPKNLCKQAASIFRPLCRNGDFIRRADGTWWLITAVTENFSGVGWVCVRAVLQVNPPEQIEDERCVVTYY